MLFQIDDFLKCTRSKFFTSRSLQRRISSRMLGNNHNKGSHSTNPAMSFPCLDQLESLSDKLRQNNYKLSSMDEGSDSSIFEPVYGKVTGGYKLYHTETPLSLDFGGILPKFQIAYETWGELNEGKSNAILLHTGLSASSHAHSTEENPAPGWWEKFIGPKSHIIDTNKFFVICTNVLGGCYGSTGPSSLDPADNEHYATRFPMLSIQDIVRAQNRLLKEEFGIKKLYASVGSSMGGMQSLAYGQLFPKEVEKIVSISACAQSHPMSIASRHIQRQVLMSDPNWNRGFYYPSKENPSRIPPHVGMKLAREIGTVTYRSLLEWESRFGNERLDENIQPALCSDFLIESYLDHQGEKFSLEYDANSMLYLSRTMDLFDLSLSHLQRGGKYLDNQHDFCSNPDEAVSKRKTSRSKSIDANRQDLMEGMRPLMDKEVLVIGVKSDVLFPYWQQREIVEILRRYEANENIHYYELDRSQSVFGHDTFLLDTKFIGKRLGQFLNCNG